MTQAAPEASPIRGRTAIAGIGETDYLRGTDQSVLQMVLAASMSAITDAGLTPADIDGILPPPGFVAWDEIAAHLGIRNVRYTSTPQMGGASPTAALLTAAMAISAGQATTTLIPIGWNRYSALRPRPDAPPSKRWFWAVHQSVTSTPLPGSAPRPGGALYQQRYVELYGCCRWRFARSLACNHAQARLERSSTADHGRHRPRFITEPLQAGLLRGDRLAAVVVTSVDARDPPHVPVVYPGGAEGAAPGRRADQPAGQWLGPPRHRAVRSRRPG
jgi:acetyl-CoA acetyltransferase